MTATELREISRDQSQFQVRAADSATPVFTGYALVFNSRTAIGNPLSWGFYEEIDQAAATKTLAEGDQRFLVDHQSHMLVARKSAGDLRLTQDTNGVMVDADLDSELSYVRDLTRNVEKRRITGMSFQFEVVRDEWTVEQVETSDGNSADVEVRRLLEIRVPEVSAVTFPAYTETTAALRAVSMRDDPDPLGRRAALLSRDDSRRPGGSTGDRKTAAPGESTLHVSHADLLMGGFAARYGLTV
jgi:HK97 family phage prohead protease